jgi:succinate dehydrogenase/fumarate reductase flavoprotein subunit
MSDELTRRDFIKGAAIASAGVAAGYAGAAAPALAAPSAADFDMQTDVLIVGMGLSGLTAAVRALELGAKVIAIDKDATGDWIGGNFLLAGQSLHINSSDPQGPEDLMRKAIQDGGSGTCDPAFTEVVLKNAKRSVEWFAKKGA